MSGSFTLELEKFAERTGQKRDTLIRYFCLSLFRDVVLGTPVDTGRARANWQASIGAAPEGTVTRNDKAGGTTTAKGMATAQRAAGEVFYITNNLPYIYRLEFEGHSKQAPAGWVRTAIERNAGMFK